MRTSSTTQSSAGSGLSGALHRATVSPDGTLLAAVTDGPTITIVDLRGTGSRHRLTLPRSVDVVLSKAFCLRWSPEIVLRDGDEDDFDRHSHTWLLIASSDRIVAASVDLEQTLGLRGHPVKAHVELLADYTFPQQYGKITAVEFVFDHSQALVVFDMGTHASFVSFTSLERSDISNIKFPDSRTYARSPQDRYLAILLREKGQDRLAIFSKANRNLTPQVIATDTKDVQGAQWAPDGKPLLMLWDTPAAGPRVLFITASGHPLKQLELSSGHIHATDNAVLEDHGVTGTGVEALCWVKQAGNNPYSVVAVGHGLKDVYFCVQNMQSLGSEFTSNISHPGTINASSPSSAVELTSSSTCLVWREVGGSAPGFQQESGGFEVSHASSTASEGVKLVLVNSDCGLVATILCQSPKVLWIWSLWRCELVSVIFFHDDVKQTLWHPTLSENLCVVTNDRQPNVHVWPGANRRPLTIHFTFENLIPTSKWEGRWITSQSDSLEKTQLFFLSSTRHFDIGYLGVRGSDEWPVFQSVIKPDAFGSLQDNEGDDTTSSIETPSKGRGHDSDTGKENTTFSDDVPKISDLTWFSDTIPRKQS